MAVLLHYKNFVVLTVHRQMRNKLRKKSTTRRVLGLRGYATTRLQTLLHNNPREYKEREGLEGRAISLVVGLQQ